MTSGVYFIQISDYTETKKINDASLTLLKEIESENKIKFEKELPIKVHFGEKGNTTFIKPENYVSIINYLKTKTNPFYCETNVLYKGERTFSKTHMKIAKEHGFTQLPIIIADGDHGENYEEIKINKKHFKECKIGKIIANSKQLIVIAHFKGHMLAGFGGAIKQLGMGCASRGGKLAMHAQSKPILNPLSCKKCNTCVQHCPTNACIISTIPHIDYSKCIGCATCIAVCPHDAIKINWASTTPKSFNEKLAEYALGATTNKDGTRKKIIFINFVFNITKNCDCHGHPDKIVAKDIGILASNDPVALDKACIDLIRKNEDKKIFGGDNQLTYGEKIGLGTTNYNLIKLT
ncbi:MAG: DUF362 domain-containing protein [Candidatus ainarchaeum sp.]|nr:DUF362 domain-containing protein [Candidatus ainarchaeum sp.]